MIRNPHRYIIRRKRVLIQNGKIVGGLALAFIFLTGCGGSQMARESMEVLSQTGSLGAEKAQSGNYVIKQGDQIRVRVPDYPELDTTATVSDQGTIRIRLIGELPVLGLTKNQLTKDLNSRLSVYVKNQVSVDVTIANKETQSVTVLGAVARQGVYTSPPDGSLLEVIATAGGSVTESDLRHVKIFRRGEYNRPLEVDLTRTLNVQEGDEQILPNVGPGDTVYIPKEENFVRELSNALRDTFFLFSLLTFIR